MLQKFIPQEFNEPSFKSDIEIKAFSCSFIVPLQSIFLDCHYDSSIKWLLALIKIEALTTNFENNKMESIKVY